MEDMAMKCAECSTCFKHTQHKQCFCSARCRQAFHNRSKARGATLVPVLMASRQARGTELGKWSQAKWAQLAAQFAEEDKAAGRMPMAEFLRRQQALYLKP